MKQKTHEPRRYLSVETIADRLDLHPQTIRRWEREGRFPKSVAFTPGTVRWLEDDVDRWEADRLALARGDAA